MQQFNRVVSELSQWLDSIKWFSMIRMFEVQLLFGGLGIIFLKNLLFSVLSYNSYSFLNTVFYTIPLSYLAYLAFVLGAWSTLVSRNVRYLPYGLWGYAFLLLFPFTSLSLNSILPAVVYAYLGFLSFKYSASSYISISKDTFSA